MPRGSLMVLWPPLPCGHPVLYGHPPSYGHPPGLDSVIEISFRCRGVSPCMRSNSAVALPHTRVPVPGKSLFATKLNCCTHEPDAHVNGALLPAARRAVPCTIHPCTTRSETGAIVSFSTVTVAVPSRPPISSVVGLSAARSGRTHPPVCDSAIAIVAFCRGVSPCISSNSTAAATPARVRVPGYALRGTGVPRPRGTDVGPAGVGGGPAPHQPAAPPPPPRPADPRTPPPPPTSPPPAPPHPGQPTCDLPSLS